ncbi:hypothetical protein [Desulfotignum phosphitoxidans]|jgi:hypothetical protein|uniref:Uncharacterized protein n=1 Tax=Desulfotignum phosphitoxidans DSM 13687 TaxID=1286635 RepID=S0G315_9BACT|nr:hypothetical protein [Desulfotignum phosphitoxidans]EMS81743.1 hypothetical protein Dpo_1c08850 [Desulfotignum phosphitoxidans DSM 13687]
MENLINQNNYECYWILVDILSSRFLKDTENSKSEDYLKDYYETSNNIGLEVYTNFQSIKRSVKMAKVNNTTDVYFSDKYILVDDFCDTSLVLSIGKIKPDIMDEIFSVKFLDSQFLSTYKKNLWWTTWNENYFGENIKSIFQPKDTNKSSDRIITPTLYYLKPLSASLDYSSLVEDDSKIEELIEQLHCHPTLWDIFEDTFIMNLIHSHLFTDILFLNLKNPITKTRSVVIPRSLYEIALQLAFSSWLDFQQNNLSKVLVNNYNIVDVAKEFKLKQISSIYDKFLINQAPLAETQNILDEYLLGVEKFQRNFITLFKYVLLPKLPERSEQHFWIIGEFHWRVLKQIEKIKHQQKLLEKKANEILSIFRDRMLLISTKINLKLQYSMIILTVIITILTLVLVLTDNTLSGIIRDFFEKAFIRIP